MKAVLAEARALQDAAGARATTFGDDLALTESSLDGLPQLSPSRWAVLGVVCIGLLALFAGAYLITIEATVVAAGALVVDGGPRPVLAQTSGRIESLKLKAGDQVAAGEVVANVEATDLRARERHALEALEAERAEAELAQRNELRLHAEVIHALSRKRAVLDERVRLKRSSLGEHRQHARSLQEAARIGVASRADALVAAEGLRHAEEDVLALRQELAETDLELSDREQAHLQQAEVRQRDLVAAESAWREACALVELARVHAPVSGRVESVLVREGEVVSPQGPLARIVPAGKLSRIVAFVPAKDAAFLEPGITASVELASLSVSEFGKLRARVTRVGSDVATPQEVEEVLGGHAQEALVRTELELSQSEGLSRVALRLRSGERVTVRLNTREYRIATLLFDFLHRWYPS